MKNLTYLLGVNIPLAKTNIQNDKKKQAKRDMKRLGTQILVILLAAMFIITTIAAVLPAFF